VRTTLRGPVNPLQRDGGVLAVELDIAIDADGRRAIMAIDGETHSLDTGRYSPWIELAFKAGAGIKVRGICRFYLLSCEPFRLYATPVQIDPEHPALPMSHPASFAIYLSKRLGKYGTLGLVEDTDSLNAGVLDEEAFLAQAYDLHAEREQMLFHELERNRDGFIACVFDGSDRIQHMFFRTLDADHPANRGRPTEEYADVIPDLYTRMDQLVGRVVAEVGDDPETVLWVISDHGFCQFKRGVNINSWLHQNGYLYLVAGKAEGGDWLVDVDWSRTRAFGLGLSGFYINRKGREGQGIVEEGEELIALKSELVEKLSGLIDPGTGEVAINQVWDTDVAFSGPYKADAPDLLVGYNAGFRVAWSGASGAVTDWVFEDNTKSWSGDHCIDPRLVPGVLFCNREIEVERPALVDMPSTILALFGVERPAYMKGRDLFASIAQPEPVLREKGEAVG
jgi:predicted AlkP superfamily phosphohydrolase/phosphomutase